VTGYGLSEGGVFKSQVEFRDFIRTRSPGQKRGGPFISSLGVACLISETCLGNRIASRRASKLQTFLMGDPIVVNIALSFQIAA
jgi:hypothetical protein